MRGKSRTDTINMLLIIGAALLVFEFLFDNHGKIIFLGVTALCIYAGRKKLHSGVGKLLFWFGIIFFFITLLQTLAIKFLLFAFLIYFLYLYSKSKKHPVVLKPELIPSSGNKEDVIQKKPFLFNRFFGSSRTPDKAYEWDDINIQTGFGDTVIDLSNSVFPKGEAVILVHKAIGNTQILIPYGMEVNVSYSALYGSLYLFEHCDHKAFNQNLSYQTPQYEETVEKIKIVVSVFAGDLEVKRI
ncbi:cell wall-active antibiotics response protein LiaF [Metabacillus sp. GX 13764]|uniref:cell wall-active antibiotics response protein LiaF n=1 Tax=Metabacillus kandeliae TaxID=2900151 RepID=UPI001E318D66|nr:cell wall-active antibiotics response protein LiaF [Metabacillus kandeliae]MCD7033643.1 cell wall-active antibiotics response protein LiaF [Metabacillus kandeliae]